MDVRPTFVLAAALALAADLTGVTQLRPASGAQDGSVQQPAASASASAASSSDTRDSSKSSSTEPLQGPSRILLIRDVDGEFAKAVQPLPGGKHGFKIPVGKPVNKQSLSDAVRLYGLAASPGDQVQITSMEIRSHEILIQINGGGKKHFRLRDHLQFGVGDLSTPPPQAYTPPQPPGSTLVLDYGRDVPDMTPEQLKHDLGVFLDFSKEHSASVNWIDTIPPKFKDAIQDHQAVVGMDSEMVLAAMGRPDHKVRERDQTGTETEDWIYGSPPSQTTFVTFVGDNVIRVTTYN